LAVLKQAGLTDAMRWTPVATVRLRRCAAGLSTGKRNSAAPEQTAARRWRAFYDTSKDNGRLPKRPPHHT